MPYESTVVSNASPLIYLAKIGKLNLLKQLFKEVIIPSQVFGETVRSREKTPDVAIITAAHKEGWVKFDSTKLPEAKALQEMARIHPGEAEAILLAKRRKLDLLIDEREAATTAHTLGVRTIGLLAVLTLACANGLLSYTEFKESIDALVKAGFWITIDVYNRALERAKEALR